MPNATNKTYKLGRTQSLVLHLLACAGPQTIFDISRFPGLTESGTRSAVDRLGRLGLVDLADRHHKSGRVFCLTDKGAAAERALLED
jgi:DNA-binding MarR family transcriptional regulator